MKNLSLRILIALLIGSPVLVPVLVKAQSASASATVDTSAQANIPTSGSGTTVSGKASANVTVKMTTAKGKADTEIARRITALNDLLSRVQQMTKVSSDFKTSINTAIQTQISGLNTLKTKIDADTDATTLKTDIQSITASYRIFALVLPQVRIAAAADREATIDNMISQIGVKLQARLQAAQAQGADVTALVSALTDMATKLADAQTQAQSAISTTATLVPDNGDQTKMAANTTALKGARANLQTAQQDLVAARKDVTTVLNGLKTLKVNTSATASTSAQTH
jgi:hypothetical protein